MGGKDSSFTIMISRGAGRLRVFRLSPMFLVCLCVFGVLYFAGSLVLLDKYLDELQRKNEEIKELEALKTESEEMRRILHKSRAHLKVLKEYLNNGEVKRLGIVMQNKDQDGGEMSSEEEEEKENIQINEGLVDIEDMSIQKKGRVLHVDFRLVNVKKEEGAVEGYVHILPLYNKAAEQLSNIISTGGSLEEGLPASYTEGQRFIIERFKPVEDRLAFQADKGPPSWLLVIVYNDSGELIFRKGFEVGKM